MPKLWSDREGQRQFEGFAVAVLRAIECYLLLVRQQEGLRKIHKRMQAGPVSAGRYQYTNVLVVAQQRQALARLMAQLAAGQEVIGNKMAALCESGERVEGHEEAIAATFRATQLDCRAWSRRYGQALQCLYELKVGTVSSSVLPTDDLLPLAAPLLKPYFARMVEDWSPSYCYAMLKQLYCYKPAASYEERPEDEFKLAHFISLFLDQFAEVCPAGFAGLKEAMLAEDALAGDVQLQMRVIDKKIGEKKALLEKEGELSKRLSGIHLPKTKRRLRAELAGCRAAVERLDRQLREDLLPALEALEGKNQALALDRRALFAKLEASAAATGAARADVRRPGGV
jgi:hypothetical protein